VRPQAARLLRYCWWRWVSRLRRDRLPAGGGQVGGPPWAGLVLRGLAEWAGL